MAGRPSAETIKANPIGDRLKYFYDYFDNTLEEIDESGFIDPETMKMLVIMLLHCIMGVWILRDLPSLHGNKNLSKDLCNVTQQIMLSKAHINLDHFLPLMKSVVNREPDEQIWDRLYDALEGISWRLVHW